MRWVERPDILTYLVECYAGVEGKKRQFIWEDVDGNIVIGNSRAFTDHMAWKFHLKKTSTSWVAVHSVLRELGEVVQEHAPRTHFPGKKFRNQEPEIRILKRKRTDG